MTRSEREFQVKQAIANQELEGLEVSFATKKLMQKYIDGEITAREALDEIHKRYGLK